ncbi:hypothetical protein DL96DRAFT_697552 [Flagelloscypha sp. PMI_526]|nr:hypothetical protein DL96DRAFT_697552 [Flagelloscypha sp. PMI_526]
MSTLHLPKNFLACTINASDSSSSSAVLSPIYTIHTTKSASFSLSGRRDTTISEHETGKAVACLHWKDRALTILGERAKFKDVRLGEGTRSSTANTKLWSWKGHAYEFYRPGKSWKVNKILRCYRDPTITDLGAAHIQVASLVSGRTMAAMSPLDDVFSRWESNGYQIRLSKHLDLEQRLFLLITFIYIETRWLENNTISGGILFRYQ